MNKILIANEVAFAIDDLYACERTVSVDPTATFIRYNDTDFSEFYKDAYDGIRYCQDRLKELDKIEKNGGSGVDFDIQHERDSYATALMRFKLLKQASSICNSIKDVPIHLSSGTETVEIKIIHLIDLIMNDLFKTSDIKTIQYFAKNVGKWIEENEDDIITASIIDHMAVNKGRRWITPDDDLVIVPQNLYVYTRLPSANISEPFCCFEYLLLVDGEDYGVYCETTFMKSGWCGRCVDAESTDRYDFYVVNPRKYGSPAR